MSLTPDAYKYIWLWEGETGFDEEFQRLRETGTRMEIAVAPASHPPAKFTRNEALELENQISKDMIKARPNVPRFTATTKDDGTLVATCADRHSLTWLFDYAKTVRYNGARLKVGVKGKIPFWRVSFVSPEALMREAPEELVNALVFQNAELKGLWAVEGSEAETAGQKVKCFVNEEVLNGVRRLRNEVYLGMHRIKLNIE